MKELGRFPVSQLSENKLGGSVLQHIFIVRLLEDLKIYLIAIDDEQPISKLVEIVDSYTEPHSFQYTVSL